MNDRLFNELSKEVPSPLHTALLTKVKGLARISRDEMSNYYARWDYAQERYRAERMERTDDTSKNRKKREDDKPEQFSVPLSYAQTQTFVAFGMSLFFQNEKFYNLNPQGWDDFKLRECAERNLQVDCNRSKMVYSVYQNLQDIGRFGIGPMKYSWEKKIIKVPTTSTKTTEFGGREISKVVTDTYEDAVEFEGNEVFPVDPYRFLPDTRFPLTDIHAGEFCGSESEFSKTTLMAMQSNKSVAGIKFVEPMTDSDALTRRRTKYLTADNFHDASKNIFVVTEMQVKIVPSEFKLDDGQPLGSEDFPIIYNIWYANDNRIIKLEPLNNISNKFTYECGQYTPDIQELVSKGVSGVTERMQEIIDWLYNSRIDAVTRTLDNQIIIDPQIVDPEEFKKGGRIIVATKNATRKSLREAVFPLPIVDSTTAHIADAQALASMIPQITGVSENMMGQYHSGRRSAREAGAVTQAAASRMIMAYKLLWSMVYEPIGLGMLRNSRYALPKERFIQNGNDETLYKDYSADAKKIIESSDFFVMEGLLPGEKLTMAGQVRETLSMLMTNPDAALQFDMSPKLLMDELLTLMGVTARRRFSLMEDPQTLQTIVQQLVQQQVTQILANVQQPPTDPGSAPTGA